jgi:CubicO group peptidase (beta-lactamase class C family)
LSLSGRAAQFALVGWTDRETGVKAVKKEQLLTAMLLVVLLTGCGQPLASPSPELDARIERLMERHRVPGVSIAVINDFEIEWAKGYGILEAGGDEPVTTDTLFQAASVGKPLTAAAALHFVEQGLLDLDGDVNDALVSWKVPENEFTAQADVTLKHLLSHTSGANRPISTGYAEDEEIPTLQQILNGEPPAKNPPVRIEFVPGTQRRYSNLAYVIVQLLFEDILNRPFSEVMGETIFQPLGMTSSLYAVRLPEALKSRAATAHDEQGMPAPGKWADLPEYGPGGGLWTTPFDLARFAIEIMLSCTGESNRVLSQEMVGEMLTPQNVDLLQGLGIGVLWHRAISHTGHNPPGFASILVAFPEEGWGAVVMTNGDNGIALRHEIMRLLAEEYGILPPRGVSIAAGGSLLLLLATLGLWPATYLVQRRRARKSTAAERLQGRGNSAKAARTAAVLETIVLFLVICLYVAYFMHPQGPMEWSGGIPLVKTLHALALVSALLALVLLVFTVLVWKQGCWSVLWRVHYTLFTIAVLVGVYLGYEFGHTSVVMFAIALGVG